MGGGSGKPIPRRGTTFQSFSLYELKGWYLVVPGLYNHERQTDWDIEIRVLGKPGLQRYFNQKSNHNL